VGEITRISLRLKIEPKIRRADPKVAR
jgi:hypothetical protein